MILTLEAITSYESETTLSYEKLRMYPNDQMAE